MKKFSKNLTMYICMFVAVFCAMTLRAEAANVTNSTLGDNNGITWTYNADTKTLTITGEDSGLRGDNSGSPFAAICKDVEVIKVQNCTLKGSVENLFKNLESLKSVEFDNVNTTNITDMSGMFRNCKSLASLDLSKFDTSNVTGVDSMFYNCESLASLDLSNFDTSKVTEMNWMFDGCSRLTSLDLSNFDTSNVASMYRMFGNCSRLNSLDLSSFDTSKVTGMSEMFRGCSSLSSLDLSNFNTSKVTGMSGMFSDCSSLSSLDLSNFDTSQVTNMNSLFFRCSSLSSLKVSKFNTSKVTNMSYMFYDCSSLSSLDVSKFDTSKVTKMSGMFSGCSSLSSFDVSKFNTSQVTDMSYMFNGCSSLSSLDVSKFDTSKVTDMNLMFRDCSSLSSLDVSGFDTSNATTMIHTFYNCSSLSSLDVSKFDTSKVTNMSSMFSGCSSLSGLDVSKFDTSKVTKMSGMFSGCSSLSSLDVSGFNTANVTETGNMFSRCCSLTSLDISGFDLTKVTSNELMFNDCSNLACIKTPKTVSETLPIDLWPATYIDPKGERTTKITNAFCNTTLINVDFLVSEIKLNSSSLTVHMGKTGQLTATISPEKALNKTLTWKSSNTAVAKVDENGKVTPVAPGTATITATATDGSGKSASCSVTVIRLVTGIALSETSLDMKTGEIVTITATVSPTNASNKNVEFKSSDTSVAVINLGNRVEAVGPGTATITATAVDGSGISATCSVTVVRLVSGVSLNKNTLSLNTGKSETLTATVFPADATVKGVTWESSNTKVATVDANGKVTAVGPGTATITAITKDITGVRDSCEVTVTQLVTGITLNKTSVSINTGKTYTLTATVSPGNASNKAVTWKSSNTAVATVDANGKVTAVAPGTATISATAKDGSGKSASCSVTVIQPVTGITLNKTSLSLKTGASETLTVTVSPSNASNKAVTWKSSNTAVATVDANGKVTAAGRGTATITATAKDGSGKSASCSITVTQPVTGITLNKTTLSLKTGATETLTVTVSPSNANNKAVTWKSSNTAVATVDSNGKVTAVAPGTTTISATAKDGSGKSATCTVTVTEPEKEPEPEAPETPEEKVRAFVSRMYTVALGRAAEEGGLDFYTEKLLAGDSNGACLAESFLCSPEFLNKGHSDAEYVKVLYRTFFDREPAADEVNYWVGQLNSGKSRAFVLAGFVNSVEFDNLCASYGISRGFMLEDGKPINPGIGRFAERLYTVILERAGEKDGIEYWSLSIASGVCTPKDAAKSFFLSPEYMNKNTSDAKYITTLYRTFMDREPEDGGVEYWQNVLNNGATREQILEGFADSPEFKGIMASFGL